MEPHDKIVMNKIQKLIKGLGLLFENPRLINLIMDSESHWKKYLKKHHNNLLQLPTADISQLIENSSMNPRKAG